MTDHDHSDEISTLNTLIATTIDSITGYENSAKDIDNQRFARDLPPARRRAPAGCRAAARAKSAGSAAIPRTSGSFLGKTHQRFEDLKAAITGGDEKSIINEVERGEDYLKEKFETALNAGHAERREPVGRRALLPVGPLGPRPDQPAQARHGNRHA